ncbi:DNA-binding response regulator [Xylanibacillus composti]|nr:response regulator transcription factor [Xylanibacillus composti]MDT9724883.1 DNA-binding response regulator [Xylanibacillus composti]
MAIKVLLVDDHLVVLHGLRYFLQTQPDIEIVGQALNGKEALEKIDALQPDVILMDLNMPEMDGIEATRKIASRYPEIKVIILTSFSDRNSVLPALQAGAAGYQLKDVKPEILADTILGAVDGNRMLHPEVTDRLVQLVANRGTESDMSLLTPKEREVLELMTTGLSNKEIAGRLIISEKTVKTHITRIFGKLGVQDRTQAVLHAIKHGWFKGGAV